MDRAFNASHVSISQLARYTVVANLSFVFLTNDVGYVCCSSDMNTVRINVVIIFGYRLKAYGDCSAAVSSFILFSNIRLYCLTYDTM